MGIQIFTDVETDWVTNPVHEMLYGDLLPEDADKIDTDSLVPVHHLSAAVNRIVGLQQALDKANELIEQLNDRNAEINTALNTLLESRQDTVFHLHRGLFGLLLNADLELTVGTKMN